MVVNPMEGRDAHGRIDRSADRQRLQEVCIHDIDRQAGRGDLLAKPGEHGFGGLECKHTAGRQAGGHFERVPAGAGTGVQHCFGPCQRQLCDDLIPPCEVGKKDLIVFCCLPTVDHLQRLPTPGSNVVVEREWIPCSQSHPLG